MKAKLEIWGDEETLKEIMSRAWLAPDHAPIDRARVENEEGRGVHFGCDRAEECYEPEVSE